MAICPKCGGSGKREKIISHSHKELVDCEECEGTGFVPDDVAAFQQEVREKLDRIIRILKGENV